MIEFKYSPILRIDIDLSNFFLFIIWLVFVGDIAHALIGELSLNRRALFSRNAHKPITGLGAQYRMKSDHFRCASFGFFALFLCAI